MTGLKNRIAWLPPRRVVLGALALMAAVLVVYVPAMRGGFVWDDNDRLTDSVPVLRTDGLAMIWFEPRSTGQYYPLAFSSFWLEHKIWGLNPFGYHLVNVLLHAFSAVLLWRVLVRLRVPGALLAAWVFALHPVHVESVAWISERKNTLSGVFYVGALFAYVRFVVNRELGRGPVRRLYALALFLFIAALLSKSVTCSLPAAILLILWWRRERAAPGRQVGFEGVTWGDVWLLTPMFAVGVVLGLLTVWMESHCVGAKGADWSLSPMDRILIAGRAPWFYAWKLVWPTTLTFIYPRWQIDAAAWWQYLYPLATLAGVTVLWTWRRRLGRAPLVCVLFFIGTLVPALGFFDLYPMRYSFVADHFQYLASLGPIVLLIGIATTRLARRKAAIRWGLSVALCVVLGSLTWKQGHVYKDLETLWRDTLDKNPGCWMAHNNLGNVLEEKGLPAEAMTHYDEALRLKPDHEEAQHNISLTLAAQGRYDEALARCRETLRRYPDSPSGYNNLGFVLAKQGRDGEAMEPYRIALRMWPEYPDAHNNVANALVRLGRDDEALRHYRYAVEANPRFAEAFNNLGNVLVRQGQAEEALDVYTRALEVKPSFPEAYNGLGGALQALGRIEEAIERYRQSLAAKSDNADAHFNLGNAMKVLGRLDEAERHYRNVLALRADDADAHNNLGTTLAVQRRFDEAVVHLARAVALAPSNVDATCSLAAVLSMLGRNEEAVEHLRAALRIEPNHRTARENLRALEARMGGDKGGAP